MHTFGTILATAAVLAATACGADDEAANAGTTVLPLQESALAVGGDVQADAADVIQLELTQEQLAQLAEVCGEVLEIPLSGGDPCKQLLSGHIDGGGVGSCRLASICLKVYNASQLDFAMAGYVEITDTRPAGSLCVADPERACLRIGVRTTAVLDEIATTSTPTGTATETGTTTGTDTGTGSSTATTSDTGTDTAPETGTTAATDSSDDESGSS
jgi:hypothetical protein